MGITKNLVTYIVNSTFEQIPNEAVTRIKQFVLDEIGNALGGSLLKSGKMIIEWGKMMGGTPEATLFSDGNRVPLAIASGVNTQLCMGLELMETYRNRCHPGSGMVMTALGLGERDAFSGKDLITAICTAYDVTGRIIDAVWPTQKHIQTVWNQPFQGCGPMIVAMKLLGLSIEQGMHAFGMGLGNGPTMNVHNILYVPGSMSKCANQFHSFVGVTAALLAKMGYTGYHEILDEPFAYWKTFSDTNRPQLYEKNLGEEFYINTAMAFKPWPTCRWAQPGIQSLIEIMEAEKLTNESIDSIVFRSHEKITNYPYDNTNPLTPEDAYWSVPWALAATLLKIPIGPMWYEESRFSNTKMQQAMEKVRIDTLPEATEAFEKEPDKAVSQLDLITNNGKQVSKRTEYCKGDFKMPLSDHEITAKFLAQTEQVVSKKKAEQIISFVHSLETQNDVSAIAGLVF